MPIIKRKFLPTETFAHRIKASMYAAEMSQTDVARAVGYTPTGVWNWLQGNTFPRGETLSALAGILNVSEDWLRDGVMTVTPDEAIPDAEPEAETMAEMIESLRMKIAYLSGYEPANVKLTLEFCAT